MKLVVSISPLLLLNDVNRFENRVNVDDGVAVLLCKTQEPRQES